MDNTTHIFCYGSNQFSQLSSRVHTTIQSLQSRAFAASLPNHTLIYAGRSENWDKKSVASVVPKEGNTVKGFVVQLTKEEIEKLDVFEGFPNMYDRENLSFNIYKDGQQIQVRGQAYIKQNLTNFESPSQKYVTACCCTQYLHEHMKQPSKEPTNATIVLDIVNGVTNQLDRTVTMIITPQMLGM